MARVSLLFEDGEIDGSHPNSIAFRADFHGGHEASSPAHRLAGQVIQWLDEQADTKTNIVVAPVDTVEQSRIIVSNGDFL